MLGNSKEEKIHSSKMQGMITTLENENIKFIQTDLQWHTQPYTIIKHRTDLIGKYQSKIKIIIEAEMYGLINLGNTRELYEDYSQLKEVI